MSIKNANRKIRSKRAAERSGRALTPLTKLHTRCFEEQFPLRGEVVFRACSVISTGGGFLGACSTLATLRGDFITNTRDTYCSSQECAKVCRIADAFTLLATDQLCRREILLLLQKVLCKSDMT